MDMFKIKDNLLTNTKSDWMLDIDSTDIQPVIIQKYLATNDMLRVQVRWLDKYVFSLPSKMYLSLAWSILTKTKKAPYIKYIKKKNEEEEFDFILSKIRRQFMLSDNDYNSVKDRLIKQIKDDMVGWFTYYGVPKTYWKKYYLHFDKIKETGRKIIKQQKGLEAFGL